ncbi:NAD(P)/FAD-dependent oxidoreductase [Luteolibacter algae]|uniref:NAD(P)/FAD-dependent oxidoreductase n=1 Tax=Luteolibacter algae TaxID=454151 RepID=UPI0036DBC988
MRKTITIIGGGLTGLSLAIALRRREVPVILHEAASYPRHRVCGEFISGVSAETLENLGISGQFSDCLHHTSIAWYSKNELLRRNSLPAPAIAISRYLLDDRLQKLAVALGVELHQKSRQRIDPGKSGVVWSAGRKPARGEWIGLKAHLRGIENHSAEKAHLEMHSGPQGYLGITPVENGWSNVCGLFRLDKTIPGKRESLIPAYLRRNGNTVLASAIEDAEWKPASFNAVAGFQLGLQAPLAGLLSLGDSHAIIPPFTGNGMTMAFQSAEIATPHLISYADSNSTWEETCSSINSALSDHFRKRLTASRMIHPLLFQPFSKWLLRHTPIQPVLALIR